MNSIANEETPKTAADQARPASAQNFVSPEVNIFKTKDGYVLEAEMPGVNKEGLEITVEANTLTIHGRRDKTELKAQALYREALTEDYRRVFKLDPVIDTAKIQANLEQGVLTVRLPNSERATPRKVTVSD